MTVEWHRQIRQEGRFGTAEFYPNGSVVDPIN
jgi:hypothetical protein